jgi:hypothetical protein
VPPTASGLLTRDYCATLPRSHSSDAPATDPRRDANLPKYT